MEVGQELELDIDAMMDQIAEESQRVRQERRERAKETASADTFGLRFSF